MSGDSRGRGRTGEPLGVAMHCTYFPPEVGGLESHVHDLGRSLARLGGRVEMVTSRSVPGSPARERMDGIRVRRTWLPGRHPLGWTLHALLSIPALWRSARRCDVVHAHTFSSALPARAAARLAGGRPVVLTLHTSHFLRRAGIRLWRPVLAWLVKGADHVLATSREIGDVAEDLAPGIRVQAVTNAVDVERFRPRGPAAASPGARDGPVLRIVAPRRLYPKNGVELLVRAMPRILGSLPTVEAWLVGDGPERERLEALARRLEVAGAIRFLGARPHAEMPALLRSARIAVIPSLMEATSVAALEAMACGLPVAASRVGGLPEIVDEEVGILFRPGDPADLAEKVVELLRDPDLEVRGRRARERVVRNWAGERLARRHLEIYERLVRERREKPERAGEGGRR